MSKELTGAAFEGIVYKEVVKTPSPFRTLLALTLLSCLVALLMMPGATSMVFVRSHSTGKQIVRVISVLTLVALAAAVCQGFLHSHDAAFHASRQVYLHGFGPDLIDKTCVRLC